MALSYPCNRPVGAWRGRARPVGRSHGSSGRTTPDGLSCRRHRSPAVGLPAPPRSPRHSCSPPRPRGPRGCRPSATSQAAPAHRSGARPRACAILSLLPPSPPCWQVCRQGQPWEPRVLGLTSRSLPCVPQRAPGMPASANILTLPVAWDDSRPGPLRVCRYGTPPRRGVRRTRPSASCWHGARRGASPIAIGCLT